ncbi:hypothetical protein D3C72_2205120 [compost metagenome]
MSKVETIEEFYQRKYDFMPDSLSAGDIQAIDDAFAKTNVQGDRYPAHLQKRVGN